MARPGLTKHPKFRRLMRMLGIRKHQAWGLLECLWEPAYETGNAIIGDVADVEDAADWAGEQGALVNALVACGGAPNVAGFVELCPDGSGRYQIHDLIENAPDYVQARKGKEQARKLDRKCDHCNTTFRSSEKRAKYCTDACRQAGFRSSRRAQEQGENEVRNAGVTTVTERNGEGDRDGVTDVTQRNAPPAPAPAPAHTEGAASRPARTPKTGTNANTTTPRSRGPKALIGAPPGFVRFWHAYPAIDRKDDCANCRRKWEKDGLETIADEIVAHVEASAKSQKWLDEEGRFVPAPLVYLNKTRYHAPLPPAAKVAPVPKFDKDGVPILTAAELLREADEAFRNV